MVDLDIKTIPCQQYLTSRGIEPKSTRGKTIKYLCPWRGEKIPSLHIYPESNKFFDFGEHVGGSVIDLCMKVEGVDFKDACMILSGKEKYTLQTQKLPERQQESPIKILWSGCIESAWLIRYIEGRCIPIDVARRFCKQARIEITAGDQKYRKTVLAFRSDKGGYEFRNQDTKLSNSPKFLTTINPGNDTLNLIEGFFDFLSYVVMWGYTRDETYIVLNSIGHIAYIDFSKYKTVNYYCDNDKAGCDYWIKIEHPNKQDKRTLFTGFNDLSEYLCNGRNETHKRNTRQDGNIFKLLGWGQDVDYRSV